MPLTAPATYSGGGDQRRGREGRSEVRRRAGALLQRIGLGERLAHQPSMLSGGEQQRVAVARALIMKPELLLADEPTGDLDENTADSLHGLLREMHSEHGLTSIIATHNPRLAAACDRVLRLEQGKLLAEQTVISISIAYLSNLAFKFGLLASIGGRDLARHAAVGMGATAIGLGIGMLLFG